ncbi:hypothetical protein BIW11_04322 [Tropilaelaps mercedesae]|uniref:Uncharacterized protein n=1 Tax=Tropilaelaps mercedesae TaxID=418985 RepID=A0A1V9X8F2_9ACAR|nr:hypothetical protein BIW11_04322 [Tropilaelaps mercedesae]
MSYTGTATFAVCFASAEALLSKRGVTYTVSITGILLADYASAESSRCSTLRTIIQPTPDSDRTGPCQPVAPSRVRKLLQGCFRRTGIENEADFLSSA